MDRFQISAVALATILAATGPCFAQVRDLSVQQQLVADVTSDESDLKVTAWVDHEDNSYRIGEAVQLSVKVNADAYLTIIGVGPSGKAVLLYPNAFQPGKQVASGETVQIPGTDAPSQIVTTAPAGVELIRVVASRSPIDVISPDLLEGTSAFRSIRGGAEQVAKDLEVVASSDDTPAFYDKVIFTEGEESVELPMESADDDQVTDRRPPLIATDRTEYEVGDVVQLAITAMEECNLWVVNVSSDGSKPHLLFPNARMGENKLQAGQTVVVSGGNSPVKVKVAGPAGTEAIYAVCSEDETPPWQTGLDFSQLFPSLDDSEGLGKALIALDGAANEPSEEPIPDVYSMSSATVTVVE